MIPELKMEKDSAHGGEGWVARTGSLRDDLGTAWSRCGIYAECGKLGAVLLHRPGVEIENIHDAAGALWLDLLDPNLAREQHDALASFYRRHKIDVFYVQDVPQNKPNMYFMRDLFAMTPEGAIVARMASKARAGEEQFAAKALAQLGIPILMTVRGAGTFEGPDLVIVNDNLAFVGQGIRTNDYGANQVIELLKNMGIEQIVKVQLNYGCGHLDGVLSVIDRDLAILYPTQVSYVVWETLKKHGFRILDLPDPCEAQVGMAINMVALEPGHVLIPAGNPITRHTLEKEKVQCEEIEVSELMKGGGSVHCMTGVLKRARLTT